MSEEEILIALKEIHARYCIPASEQNYTDKDYACMQYEKLVIHLQKEIDRLNNIIKEVREYLTDEGVCILNKGKKENERLVWTWENYYDLLEILKGSDIE